MRLAVKFCNILAISFSSIKQYYDEKYDRNNFIKNVILDNILPGDIYVKARELHFNTDVNRVVLLIRDRLLQRHLRLRRHPEPLPGQAEGLCLQHQREATSSWSRRSRAGIESKDLEKLARSIVDTLGSEFYTRVVVGIGTTVVGVKDPATVGDTDPPEYEIVGYE